MTHLVAIQQPQSTFHKDEGGKTNTLIFRVRLQGDLDMVYADSKGEIPLEVIAVFEDGTEVPKQKEVIEILGSTEKPSGPPCLCLTSHLGGVSYRLKQVSKRLDDRKVCVRISPLQSDVPLASIQSEGTLVFSKRKNREQRESQQFKEKQEMERREEEAVAQQLLLAKRSRKSSHDWEEEVEDLKRRMLVLEKTVRDQQEALQLFRPPTLGRSVSQATWGIPATSSSSSLHNNFGIPPDLRRESSGESLLLPTSLRRLTTTTSLMTEAPSALRREVSSESLFDNA